MSIVKQCIITDVCSVAGLPTTILCDPSPPHTGIMKSLESMREYITGKHGKEIKWEVWSKANERGIGQWYTSKRSVAHENSLTIGFCQVSWDELQMSLFDMLVSA